MLIEAICSRDGKRGHAHFEETKATNIDPVATPPYIAINGKGDSSKTWRAYPHTPLIRAPVEDSQ
jgi:hypothetical protein